MEAVSARARLEELFIKLDAFFARARERTGGSITCAPGCDDCCRRTFSITAIEADAVGAALDALPAEERARIRARAGDEGACAALDDGRCAVYAARPTICRTHGLPIRFAAPAGPGRRSLPVVDACPRNFAGEDLASVDPAAILDQTTLSTVLAALDAARAVELGVPPRARVELAKLFAG